MALEGGAVFREILAIDLDLAQKVQVLNIAVLVDLSDFEVVDLLNHDVEGVEDLVLLSIVFNARLFEDALIRFRDDFG